MSHQPYPVRNYAVGQHLFTLRNRAQLTQAALAEQIGVHRRSVQKWESGETYPTAENLRAFISALLALNVFTKDHEYDEAVELWMLVSEAAPQPLPIFDAAWFRQIATTHEGKPALPRTSPPQPVAVLPRHLPPVEHQHGADGPQLPPSASVEHGGAPFHNRYPPNVADAPPSHPTSHVDWGLAQDVAALYGRVEELATLRTWVLAERCRLVTLVGIGGIGKTSLAIRFAQQEVAEFSTVLFRSLGEAPSLPELLDDLLHEIARDQMVAPASLSDKLAMLVDLMRQTRSLLILDNVETLRQSGTTDARYLAGFEAYSTLFQRLGETPHQSCVLLTTRERLPELAALEGARTPVRTLQVNGLPEDASRSLIADSNLIGTMGDAAALARRYDGNPLALKLVAEPIRALFGGDIATFLSEGHLFFDGVGRLLAQQINRASSLEQSLLMGLTIAREPIELEQLILAVGVATGQGTRSTVLAALHALWRRNLIERGQASLTFTLQRVVLEYLTEHLVERVKEEVLGAEAHYLRRHALVQATAKEYIRRNQEHLIAGPLLEQLTAIYSGIDLLEERLHALLDIWRDNSPAQQGYGPGNVVNLLRLLRGHLRGINLAHLTIRQAYLQGVDAQDTSLKGALLQDSPLTKTFDVVTSIATSRSGEYWAAASRRGEVLVWSAGGQTLHRMWRAHSDMIWTIAFSPDERTLATGSWDGAVHVWDVMSGTLRWTGRHKSHANRVAFAPDGNTLASCGNDATVRLWDLQSGEEIHTLPHDAPVPVLQWAPNGRLLASGDMNGCIRLWDVSALAVDKEPELLTEHTDCVDGLAFSPDGNTLASASWDGTVKLWDMTAHATDQRLLQTLRGHTDRAMRLAWSPDGRILASCSRDQTILLWDADQHHYRATLRGHSAGINGLSFLPDGRTLLSSSEDGTLRVWDAASGQCTRVLQGFATALYDVDWSPDGSQLASGGTDYVVAIHSMADRTPPRILRGHAGVVFGVGWNADEHLLASSEWDNMIRLWDTASGICLQVLAHPVDPGNYFYGLAWSPDGRRLACGTYRRGVQIYEKSPSSPLWAGDGWLGQPFHTWIRHVAWRPDGAQLAGGGDDGSVYVWDAHSGALLQTLAGHGRMVTRLGWSPDGTRLISGGSGPTGGELFVWDPQCGERLYAVTQPSCSVYTVAWGGSDKVVISGSDDGLLRWWDVLRGECIHTRPAHEGTVQALRRSPDGTKLASCGDDGAILIWDLHSAQRLRTLRRDRPYERLDITGISGLTDVQRRSLLALGAIEQM